MIQNFLLMIIFLVLSSYDDNKRSIYGCIYQTDLFINLASSEDDLLDTVMNSIPDNHPSKMAYDQLKRLPKQEFIINLKIVKEKLEAFSDKEYDMYHIEKPEEVINLSELILK